MSYSEGTPVVTKVKVVFEDKQSDEKRLDLSLNATAMNDAAIDVLVDSLDKISRMSVRRILVQKIAPNADFIASTDGVTNQPCQLVFENVMGYQGSFEVPHVDNSCFVDTSGTGANSKVLKTLADLDAASAGTPAELLGNFIHHIIDGDVIWNIQQLPPTAFIRGYREN